MDEEGSAEDEYWSDEEECSTCGYVDSWCDMCGFHGHECPGDEKEEE